jgi:hypothetical protein
MLISKFYNSTNKSKQQQTNRANSRVLTPSSIPIFVLPPTLDNFNANASPKPELNGNHYENCIIYLISFNKSFVQTINKNEINWF